MKKGLALLTLSAIVFRLFSLAGGADALLDTLLPRPAAVCTAAAVPSPTPVPLVSPQVQSAVVSVSAPVPTAAPVPVSPSPSPAPITEDGTEILPTTIAGGLTISNSTSYDPDIAALLAEGADISLPAEGPQILIIHTHGSEAYAQDPHDLYVQSDVSRTQDKNYNVIRVGDELCQALEGFGLRVLHDREIYDYPSYTGSYSRSQAAIEGYLAQYPDIAVVIDLHRDALGSGDVIYKTVAEVKGEACSQLMLLVGTGENGLAHPNWQENLKLALTLQQAVNGRYPTLARPIALTQERYNQHLTTGSLILEVGSSGNTLREALCAVRLFADAIGETLTDMTEVPGI